MGGGGDEEWEEVPEGKGSSSRLRPTTVGEGVSDFAV